MKTLVLYTLITVTNAGAVNHSDGYKSLHSCEEAKNVAKYGETLEQESDRKAKNKSEKDAWLESHPARRPATQTEKDAVEQKIKHHDTMFVLITCPAPEHPFHVTDNLLIQDDKYENWCGTLAEVNPSIIKYAECVIEKDKDK